MHYFSGDHKPTLSNNMFTEIGCMQSAVTCGISEYTMNASGQGDAYMRQ